MEEVFVSNPARLEYSQIEEDTWLSSVLCSAVRSTLQHSALQRWRLNYSRYSFAKRVNRLKGDDNPFEKREIVAVCELRRVPTGIAKKK